jgi:hypothetical protein
MVVATEQSEPAVSTDGSPRTVPAQPVVLDGRGGASIWVAVAAATAPLAMIAAVLLFVLFR